MFFVKNLPSAVDDAGLALYRPVDVAFSSCNGREIATFLEKTYSAVYRRTIFYIYLHTHADAE